MSLYELPKREKEIRCEMQGGAVVQVLRPLTDEQYHALNDASILDRSDPEQATVVYRLGAIPGLYEDRLLRIEGITVDAQPFDPGNPAHLERVPQLWKRAALTRLISYANGLTGAERGNSSPPAESSREEVTPSAASAGGSSA